MLTKPDKKRFCRKGKTIKEGKMKIRLFGGLLFLTTSLCVSAQQNQPAVVLPEPKKSAARTETEKQENSPGNTSQTDQTLDQTPEPYVRPDGKKRFNRYVKSIFGPVSLAKDLASAGISTATNSPEEWGPHWQGFGRRFASNLGKSAIKNTTQYALDETFKLDSNFYRSRRRNIGARLKNAVISPFTARTKNGRRVFGFPRLVGTYSSNIIAAETWYPKRYDYKNGLRSGTISLGTNILFNLVKEFFFKK